MIGEVVKRFGKLDILVNNAGVFETGSVAETIDTSGFDRQQRINYEAVVTAIREASKVMGDGGRIISVSSALALRSTWPGLADYSATKRAVEGYTKGAARDLGPKGITVNAIAAGSTNTEMNPDSSPFAEAQAAATALGRFGRAEEIASVVAFIASPAASFITGSIIPVTAAIAPDAQPTGRLVLKHRMRSRDSHVSGSCGIDFSKDYREWIVLPLYSSAERFPGSAAQRPLPSPGRRQRW